MKRQAAYGYHNKSSSSNLVCKEAQLKDVQHKKKTNINM